MRRKAIRTNFFDVYAHLSTCKHNAAVRFMSYMCVLCSIRLRVSVVHVIPLSIFSYYFLDNVLKLFAFFYAYKLVYCFVLFHNFISKCKHQGTISVYKRAHYRHTCKIILIIYGYCMENNTDGWLLSWDFEKAFDLVEWNCLFQVLKQFFGVKISFYGSYFFTQIIFLKLRTIDGFINRGITQSCTISVLLISVCFGNIGL